MLRIFVCFLFAGVLAGCAGLASLQRAAHGSDTSKPAPESRPAHPAASADEDAVADVTPVADNARTVEEFDTTTAAQRRAAASPAARRAGGQDLGVTIASLGTPSEPGFWLKTPLVAKPGRGRVDYPEKGTSVVVDLIPIEGAQGAGSRMSLAALRLLQAPLTGLPEVRVFLLSQ